MYMAPLLVGRGGGRLSLLGVPLDMSYLSCGGGGLLRSSLPSGYPLSRVPALHIVYRLVSCYVRACKDATTLRRRRTLHRPSTPVLNIVVLHVWRSVYISSNICEYKHELQGSQY